MLSNIVHLPDNGRLGTRPLPFFHDSRLPNLWQLTDTNGIAQRLQGYFRLRYPKQRLNITDCVIEQLYYRPEKSCKILYRLQFRDRIGEQAEQWFSAQMYPAEKSFAKFSRAQEKATTAVSFWEPVSFWPELDTIFWVFPHDPLLKQLPKLIQPGAIEQLFATYLPTESLSDRLAYQRLKMMPRKRCLLQFGNHKGNQTFITKSYATHPGKGSKGAYAHNIFEDVYFATKNNPLLTVPRPLFYAEEMSTYVQEAWVGKTPTATDCVETIEQAAHVLAQFHQLDDLPRLQSSQRTVNLVSQIQQEAAFLDHFLPYDLRLPSIANQLMLVAVVLMDDSTYQRPTHGAFRLNQLLEQNGRFALLDLDDAGWGDPHLDVAECVASMLITHFTEGAILAELQAASATFISSYSLNVPWQIEWARLHSYIALSLFHKLVGAFRRLETAVFPKIDSLLQLIEHHLEQSL